MIEFLLLLINQCRSLIWCFKSSNLALELFCWWFKAPWASSNFLKFFYTSNPVTLQLVTTDGPSYWYQLRCFNFKIFNLSNKISTFSNYFNDVAISKIWSKISMLRHSISTRVSIHIDHNWIWKTFFNLSKYGQSLHMVNLLMVNLIMVDS